MVRSVRWLLIFAATASSCSAAEIWGTVVDNTPAEKPVTGVVVRAVGISSDTTTSAGEFRIVVDASRIGRRVTLVLESSKWTVVKGQKLEVIVAADPLENPLQIKVQKTGTAIAAAASNGLSADFSVITDDPEGLLGASYSATRTGGLIQIVPHGPYLDLFKSGGPITPLRSAYDFDKTTQYPQIDIKVTNNSAQSVFFRGHS